MELYLIRHGNAYSFGDARWPNDKARPLSPEGEEEVARVAALLSRFAAGVDALVTSPVLRAVRTAEIIRRAAGWPEPIAVEEMAGRPPPEMLDALAPWRETSAVAVVGHDPTISRFGSYLLTGEGEPARIEMKTGAVVCLSFEGPPSVAEARLQWLIMPRLLEI